MDLCALPSGLLAHIGRFMDKAARNACVLASRQLWSVHEAQTCHKLTFRATDPAKLASFAALRAHVRALMPRLNTLHLVFSGFETENQLPSLPDVEEGGPPQSVSLLQCAIPVIEALAARYVGARLLVVLSLAHGPEQAESMLRRMGPLYCLRCPHALFNRIAPDAFDAVENVSLELPRALDSAVDLRGLRHSKVELLGNACSCQVRGGDKVVTIADLCFSDVMGTQLLDSLRRDGCAAVNHLMITDLFPEVVRDNVWYATASLLPTTVRYAISAHHPQTLRFLDHLTAEVGVPWANIQLVVVSRNSHLAARLVCLLLRRSCGAWYYGSDYAGDDEVDRMTSVRDVLAAMDPEARAMWHMASLAVAH